MMHYWFCMSKHNYYKIYTAMHFLYINSMTYSRVEWGKRSYLSLQTSAAYKVLGFKAFSDNLTFP